ncbi:hypothetical protein [Anaeromicropila herbilytica]|uniref:Uncharacterized protein n=1 Tax=Anaeromicropila herbilytica TaxID=2785025 RepID=A0A7R7IDP7_9FIRM|nr:hypothetical protein [Anaeromicropila herbilytica]BCN30233.1 hypothetical protein bsdtb5_15280 [Anaeromicropila herbilytica]
MEELKQNFLKKLKERIQNCTINSKKLREDECYDEAKLEIIKINIYEIFQTLFSATQKKVLQMKAGNPNLDERECFTKEYLLTFDKIPKNWADNYQKAKEREMVEVYYVEEVKLATAKEIKELFLSCIE